MWDSRWPQNLLKEWRREKGLLICMHLGHRDHWIKKMFLTCLLLARAELSNGDIVNQTQGPKVPISARLSYHWKRRYGGLLEKKKKGILDGLPSSPPSLFLASQRSDLLKSLIWKLQFKEPLMPLGKHWKALQKQFCCSLCPECLSSLFFFHC